MSDWTGLHQLSQYFVYVLFLMLGLTACDDGVVLSKEQLTGVWITSTDSYVDQGIGYREVLLDHFREDGTFITHTSSELYRTADGAAFVKIEGPDKGRWTLEEGKLRKDYESSAVTRFESQDPTISKEQFEAKFAKKLLEVEWLIPIQLIEKVLVVEDQKTRTQYTMVRHEPELQE